MAKKKKSVKRKTASRKKAVSKKKVVKLGVAKSQGRSSRTRKSSAKKKVGAKSKGSSKSSGSRDSFFWKFPRREFQLLRIEMAILIVISGLVFLYMYLQPELNLFIALVSVILFVAIYFVVSAVL